MNAFRCLVRAAASLVCLLAVTSLLQAAPWAVVVDNETNQLSLIDFGTTPATPYGPFLKDQVGGLTNQLGSTGGGRFDVVITPDGKNALISNFGDSCIYRVNIANPTNPIVTGFVSNGFFAEDIAITGDGKYALVTDGGFSPVVGIIDMSNFTTSVTHSLTSGSANAVAIAPDNRTVVMADYFSEQLICGTLCPTGLVTEYALPLGTNADNRPVNVAISPDGKTVLTANAGSNIVNVFQIVSPGVVVPGVTPVVSTVVSGLYAQSIAFAPQGNRAYVLQNGAPTNNMLTWLQINAPGNVTMGGSCVASLAAIGSSQFFGVDTLAVTPDGSRIVASNPTASDGVNVLSVVDAGTFAVSRLDAGLLIPVGVAFVPTSELAADLDGDRKADFVTVVGSRWYVWFSTLNYMMRFGPYELGAGLPAVGDVDGDGLPDLLRVVGSNWYVWFSTMQYQVCLGPFDLGICGLPAAGDVDGDGLDDLLMTVGSKWFVWFSTAQYQVRGGPYDLGVAGLPAAGDLDGDGMDDLVMTAGPNWFVWHSASQYMVRSGPVNRGIAGFPSIGDVDGDGRADLIDCAGFDWYVWFARSQYQGRVSYNSLMAP